MSVLVDADSRVLVQGITGREGGFHTRLCIDYGTRVVAGMTPGKGGTTAEGVPVFNTVVEAVRETGADVSLIFVPAPFAADAILEASDAGVPLVVCITEGIPVRDMVTVHHYLAGRKTRLIGPNCPGIISPGKCKMGIIPGDVCREGRVGVVSRSGTLLYEAIDQLSRRGIGQSTCFGIGGDPIVGMSFVDALELFEQDTGTDAVFVIGEIGGTAEQEAARYIKSRMSKPVAAFVAGSTAPPGRRMGHAGAIVTGSQGTAQEKVAAFSAAGVAIARSPAEIGVVVEGLLKHR
ncbi:MAG: succinate--CoA ligase subunit alpha [Chloroflexi bacterium]|nr:succinate--CoA ligase subunit alpha [Chloroflexota bacterium]